MADEKVPFPKAPLNEWQTETLKNQAALVELQRDQVDAINALAAHAENMEKSLGEIANLLDRLVLQGGGWKV